MYTLKSSLIGLSVSLVLCSISVRRTGWLDRVVEYQKKRFIDDLMKQTVKISARIEKAPPGYVDSKEWDYDSVIRLLTLIRNSEGAAPVRRAFRRAMKTNRRFLNFPQTFKAFPSLIKNHPNDFHYDVDSGEYYADVELPESSGVLDEDAVIVVTNPVEAKLPSGIISVNLLKEIMERRAEAGRIMPTPFLNISWPVTPKKNITEKTTTSAAESTSESNSTSASDSTSEAKSSSGAEEKTTAATEGIDTSTVPSPNGNDTDGDATTTAATDLT